MKASTIVGSALGAALTAYLIRLTRAASLEFSIYDEAGNEVIEIDEDSVIYGKGKGSALTDKLIHLATEDDSVALASTDRTGRFNIPLKAAGIGDLQQQVESRSVTYLCTVGAKPK